MNHTDNSVINSVAIKNWRKSVKYLEEHVERFLFILCQMFGEPSYVDTALVILDHLECCGLVRWYWMISDGRGQRREKIGHCLIIDLHVRDSTDIINDKLKLTGSCFYQLRQLHSSYILT